jgi:hypothetical protein
VPKQTTERPFTDDERAQLQRVLRSVPDDGKRRRIAVGQAVVVWAFGSLAAAVLWLVTAAIAKAVAGVSFGWSSPYVVHGLAACLLVSGAFAIASSLRWMKFNKSFAPVVEADLSRGIATVEDYEFSEARRFQEPEHGGLIYFLRSSNGRPYVLYDTESQNLGVQQKNPLDSSFVPHSGLRVVRAAGSRLVLSSEPSGSELPRDTPVPLTVAPAQWPEEDEYCTVAWDELEARYAAPAS